VPSVGFVHPNLFLFLCVRQCIFLLFGVIVNIFLETGIVLLLLRSQVASSDRTHTDAPEGERERERGRERRQVPARLRNAAAAETTNASEFGIEFGSAGKE